jgi:glycosyltransferase involved in cell wall biosynthesis
MTSRTTRTPQISIGLPVLDGEKHLPRCLDSLLGQTLTDFEIIISDNASCDSTPEICHAYSALDGRIRFLRNETNLGLAANYNRVFRESRGTYFKWAPHDDWIDPEFLAKCHATLEAERDVVACTTAVTLHDNIGHEIDCWQPGREFVGGDVSRRARALIEGLQEPHALYGLIRSDALRQTQLMGTFLGADRVLLLALVLQGEIRVLPEFMYHYTHYRPVGRVYSVYNDPNNKGRLPLRTWALIHHHLKTLRASELAAAEKATIAAAVLHRHAWMSRRLLAAEIYHSSRILAQRTRQQPT